MAIKRKPLTIRDEIHGDLIFGPVVRQVLDHPLFQRLRYIRQLGLAEYVFPCATHTRFQHSLGASNLAAQYTRSLIRSWLVGNFDFGEVEGTQFHTQRTFEAVHGVSEHPPSYEFWLQVASLAGMLHDVGHGPWSHTFEVLMLKQDFEAEIKGLPSPVREQFEARQQAGEVLHHEDISILYISKILSDLEKDGSVPGASRFFLPVSHLVNRKLRSPKMEAALKDQFEGANTVGGTDFLTLLGPLISGPFDVDRIDYIQRDGRNCGVSIGGIEWRRIVNKLVPCLAHHPNENGEPENVVLISGAKNQHVLDDFIFSLFQMYAQVYMHPKIVGLEETLRTLVRDRAEGHPAGTITLEQHASFSDDSFRRYLSNDFGLPEVESLLLRRQGSTFRVTTSSVASALEQDLSDHGYEFLRTLDRPMLKDGVGIYLYSGFKEASHVGDETHRLMPWELVSPVARQFYSINYSPKVWLRRDSH